MKRSLNFLLKGSISLFVIGFFITMAQTSCTKGDGQARPAGTAGVTRQPLMLLEVSTTSTGVPVPSTFGLMNADGSNYHTVTIQGLPAGVITSGSGSMLTPDGTHIIYPTANIVNISSYAGLYESTINGDSTVQILAPDPSISNINIIDIR